MTEPLCPRCRRDTLACRCHWLTVEERADIDQAARAKREAATEAWEQGRLRWAKMHGLENVLEGLRSGGAP